MGNGAAKDVGKVALEQLMQAKKILDGNEDIGKNEKDSFTNIAKYAMNIVNLKLKSGKLAEVDQALECATWFAQANIADDCSLTTMGVIVMSNAINFNGEVFENPKVQQHLAQSLVNEEPPNLFKHAEVTQGIARIATSNDQASVYIANSPELLSEITKASVKTDIDESENAKKALVSLSLNPENNEILSKTAEEIEKLETQSSTASQSESSSERIQEKPSKWKTLARKAFVVAKATDHFLSAVHVVISYADGGNEIAEELKSQLNNKGFKVWLSNDIHGDMLETLSEAVAKASAVVILISKNYMQDTFCKLTTRYAAINIKKIVPVKVESCYNETGWLKLVTEGLMHFKFYSKESVDVNDKFMKAL